MLAVLAEFEALVADVEAPLALVDAAEADAAAAVADAPAAAASTSKKYLAASALVVSGCAPTEVCSTVTWKMLLVDVSLTMSRTKYKVPVAQLPRFDPMNSVADGFPDASNDSTLPARTDDLGKVMSMVVGSVCGACNARVTPSAFCCAKMVC